MSEDKITPLELHHGEDYSVIYDNWGNVVSQQIHSPDADDMKHLEFIVRACNSHYELLETLELIKEGIALKKIADACILNHANNTIQTLNEIVSLAIAKAEGK